jgi:hypothetical protein
MVGPIIPPRQYRRLTRWLLKEDLSGFETGVAVMPLVKGSRSDSKEHPTGRIRNTHKLLTTAAVIMSFFLLTSSLVTTLLIPPAEFQHGAKLVGVPLLTSLILI